jgi:hypothetical protein
MKANELKVKDLMVGDWVISFGTPHKVVGIRTDIFEPHIKTDMSDTWYEEGIENLLEPIPLTPEILEKNGFEFDDVIPECRMFMGIDDRVALRNDKEYMNSNNEWHVHIDSEDYCTIANCELTYVHELQHILRLCKIDKEIVV